MADLVRGFDWANTQLGGVDSWADTLVTTVNMLLASRHPMFLWWGPDLIQFYNDGYLASIREDKHPRALGQRGKECWPEIWPIIGPQIEGVMTRGESTWNRNQLVPIYRSGRLEEVYWTYGYSPVRDKDGAVQGTLVVCSETTEPVLSERRSRTLLAIGPDAHALAAAGPAAQAAMAGLNQDRADIPFAALYLAEGERIFEAGRIGAVGDWLKVANWPVKEAIADRRPRLIENLPEHLVRLADEAWPELVRSAYVLPLAADSDVAGAIVFGISPRLPFDDEYRTFLELVASRIASLLQRHQANEELENKVAERTAALEAEVFDRQRAESGLRALTGRLLQTQDEERRHMARELHDHAGQTLVALSLCLHQLQQTAQGKDTEITRLAGEGQQLSDELSKEIRTLSYLLHPPLLDEAGLFSALGWYVDGFSKRSGIHVDLSLPQNLGRLPRDLEMVVFRIVQESLTNVHRHSGSEWAKIFLTRAERSVEFEISDGGGGISAERQSELRSARSGVGVRGMEERVRQFGGTLEIVSDGGGTRVVVRMPVEE